MPYPSLFRSVDSIRTLTNDLWLALTIIWALCAFAVKPTMVKQSSKARIWYVFILALGAYLIFAKQMHAAWLNVSVFRVSMPLAQTGFGFVCLGMAFAIWARLILGRNWSGAVTIKLEHTLIQSGPYRLVRHPIYTGLLIALLGSALQYSHLRSFLGVLLIGFGFWLKSLLEEQLMAQRFGNQYLIYRQQVHALIPFIF